MTRYRWKCGRRRGRWLPTAREAREAAVRAGEASKDEHSGTVYLDPLTEIEEDDVRR